MHDYMSMARYWWPNPDTPSHLPYDPQHPWPHEQISKDLEGSLCPALVRAGAHAHDTKYVEAQKRFACKQTAVTMLEALSGK